MNKKKIFAALLALVGLISFSACSDKDTETGEPYLKFDLPATTIDVNVDGLTQANRKQVTIRSNRAWKVVYANPADTAWLHLFVNEGVDDGIIHYWVDKNTAFNTREGKFNFVANDGTTLNTLGIIQEANQPFVQIVNGEQGFNLLPDAGTLAIAISHNVPFEASLSATTWARIDRQTEDTVYISYDKNRTTDRTVTLTAKGTGEQSSLVSTATITQAAPGLVMNEDFTWLSQGEEKPYYEYPEEKFANWSAAEKGHGWTSLNGFLYGGIGYIKLGKTKIAGDAVSPPLTGLTTPTDVQVDFKGVGYTAGNNKHDDAVMKVGIIGPGELIGDNSTIEINGTSYKCIRFELTSFPKVVPNSEYNPFAQPDANFTFHIKGATSETRLVFIGGEMWGAALNGVGQSKNRCYIDDVKVMKE